MAVSGKGNYLFAICYSITFFLTKYKKRGISMLKHVDHFHGSDLEEIEKCFGIKKEKIKSNKIILRDVRHIKKDLAGCGSPCL